MQPHSTQNLLHLLIFTAESKTSSFYKFIFFVLFLLRGSLFYFLKFQSYLVSYIVKIKTSFIEFSPAWTKCSKIWQKQSPLDYFDFILCPFHTTESVPVQPQMFRVIWTIVHLPIGEKVGFFCKHLSYKIETLNFLHIVSIRKKRALFQKNH